MVSRTARWVALAAATALTGRGCWTRKNPTAFRYSARWIDKLPHP